MYRIAQFDRREQEMPSEEEQTKGIVCSGKVEMGDRLCHYPLLSQQYSVLFFLTGSTNRTDSQTIFR